MKRLNQGEISTTFNNHERVLYQNIKKEVAKSLKDGIYLPNVLYQTTCKKHSITCQEIQEDDKFKTGIGSCLTCNYIPV